MEFAFFFGRDAKLAFAEALFFLQDNNIEFSLVERSEQFAVFDFPKGIDAQKIVNVLGGTAKIAKLLFSVKKVSEKALLKKFESIGFFSGFFEKMFYSAVFLSEGDDETIALQEALKQGFKQCKLKAMLKHPREHKQRAIETLSPRELRAWKMLDTGFEIVGLKAKEEFCFFQTIAATDTEAIIMRDSNRPCQSPKQAVSIRLAKILLNLSGVRQGKKLLDPFCGIGTIMQEALFNGASAVGIELDFETAAKARKNLGWFVETFKLKGNWRIIQGDSAKLQLLVKAGDFDCVATEPFMGPFINSILPEPVVKKTVTELETLYSAVFLELAKLLQKGQRIAFILPSIPCTNGKKIAVSENVFSKAGFVVVNHAGVEAVLPYSYTAIDSKLLRRIYVLAKA